MTTIIATGITTITRTPTTEPVGADHLRDPATIAAASFAIIEREAGLHRLPPGLRPVAARSSTPAGWSRWQVISPGRASPGLRPERLSWRRRYPGQFAHGGGRHHAPSPARRQRRRLHARRSSRAGPRRDPRHDQVRRRGRAVAIASRRCRRRLRQRAHCPLPSARALLSVAGAAGGDHCLSGGLRRCRREQAARRERGRRALPHPPGRRAQRHAAAAVNALASAEL